MTFILSVLLILLMGATTLTILGLFWILFLGAVGFVCLFGAFVNWVVKNSY